MKNVLTVYFPALLAAPQHTLRNLTLFLPYHLWYCARAAYTKRKWKRSLTATLNSLENSTALAGVLHTVLIGTLPPTSDRTECMVFFIRCLLDSRDKADADALLGQVFACTDPVPTWDICGGVTFVATRAGE